MTSVKLHLDHPPTFVYHPGSLVSGRIVCFFMKTKNIKKIKARLVGKEHTGWSGSQTYYDSTLGSYKTRKVDYQGDHHNFIHSELLIKGPGEIPAGKHIYPFRFYLPDLLPGSITHQYGYIRYYIDICLDRPQKADYEDRQVFKVFAPIDLRQVDPRILRPIELSDRTEIGCFCCVSGPISVHVQLEKRAFAVGEKARMRIYCENMSNNNVEKIQVQFLMNFKFKAKQPEADTKQYFEVVTSFLDGGVGAHGERTYDLEILIPPDTVIPNFALCDLFSKTSTLKIDIVIAGYKDIQFEQLIVLGHIPSNNNSTAPYWSRGNQISQANDNSSLPPYPLDPYPSDLPYWIDEPAEPVHYSQPNERNSAIPFDGRCAATATKGGCGGHQYAATAVAVDPYPSDVPYWTNEPAEPVHYSEANERNSTIPFDGRCGTATEGGYGRDEYAGTATMDGYGGDQCADATATQSSYGGDQCADAGATQSSYGGDQCADAGATESSYGGDQCADAGATESSYGGD